MKFEEAYEQFTGQPCVLHSPTWGSYFCDQVEVIKGKRGSKWKARGTISTIVQPPIEDRPPLPRGKILTVSDGNIELNEIKLEDYCTELERCLIWSQLTLIEDVNFAKERERNGLAKSQNTTNFQVRQSNLNSQIKKCRDRGLLKRPYLDALSYVGREFVEKDIWDQTSVYQVIGITRCYDYDGRRDYTYAYSGGIGGFLFSGIIPERSFYISLMQKVQWKSRKEAISKNLP